MAHPDLEGRGACLAPSHGRLRDPAIAPWTADTASTAHPRSRRGSVAAADPAGSSPPDQREVLHHCGRGGHRSLPRPRLTDAHDPVLQDTRIQTFPDQVRSEEHTSELQSRQYLVCRLLLEKKKPT